MTATTSTFTNTQTLLHGQNLHRHFKRSPPAPIIKASMSPQNRRNLVTTFLASASLLAVGSSPLAGGGAALAENWGTRSFLRERFFEPDLSPQDSAARIRQTAEGLHSIRDMLENMSWRYVMFYIRLKQAFLSKDLKIAFATLPKSRQDDYVKTANELVDNMAQFDYYVRTPKVYESYLYYEKSLKSIDDLVALLP